MQKNIAPSFLTENQQYALNTAEDFTSTAILFNAQRKKLQNMTLSIRRQLKKPNIYNYQSYSLSILYQLSKTDQDFLQVLPYFLSQHIDIIINYIVPLRRGRFSYHTEVTDLAIIPKELHSRIYNYCIDCAKEYSNICISLIMINSKSYDKLNNEKVKEFVRYVYNNYINDFFKQDLTYQNIINIIISFYPFLQNHEINQLLKLLSKKIYNTEIFKEQFHVISSLLEQREDLQINSNEYYNKIKSKLLLFTIK